MTIQAADDSNIFTGEEALRLLVVAAAHEVAPQRLEILEVEEHQGLRRRRAESRMGLVAVHAR